MIDPLSIGPATYVSLKDGIFLKPPVPVSIINSFCGLPCSPKLYARCFNPTPYHQSCNLFPVGLTFISVLVGFFFTLRTISPSLPLIFCHNVPLGLRSFSAASAISLSDAFGACFLIASRKAFG